MTKKQDKKAELESLQRQIEKTEKEYIETLRMVGKAGECELCQKVFKTTRKGQKFCSEEHRLEYWKHKRSSDVIVKLICPICYSSFSTTDNRRVYCKDECYQKSNLDKAKLRNRNY